MSVLKGLCLRWVECVCCLLVCELGAGVGGKQMRGKWGWGRVGTWGTPVWSLQCTLKIRSSMTMTISTTTGTSTQTTTASATANPHFRKLVNFQKLGLLIVTLIFGNSWKPSKMDLFCGLKSVFGWYSFIFQPGIDISRWDLQKNCTRFGQSGPLEHRL